MCQSHRQPKISTSARYVCQHKQYKVFFKYDKLNQNDVIALQSYFTLLYTFYPIHIAANCTPYYTLLYPILYPIVPNCTLRLAPALTHLCRWTQANQITVLRSLGIISISFIAYHHHHEHHPFVFSVNGIKPKQLGSLSKIIILQL